MDEENTQEKIHIKHKLPKTHEKARKKEDLVVFPMLKSTRDKLMEVKHKNTGRFQNVDEVLLYLLDRSEKFLNLENKELGITNLTKKEEYQQARESLIKSMTKEEKKEFLIKEARIIKEEFEGLK